MARRGCDSAGGKILHVLEPQTDGRKHCRSDSCVATIQELAIAAREPGKDLHRTVLIGHSFGALVLGNTISYSILGANGEGSRSSSPWDLAVAFNSAAGSVDVRQMMAELDYLYRYDPQRHANVSRSNLGEETTAVSENRPALVFLQSENDVATNTAFPIGTSLFNTVNLRLSLATGSGSPDIPAKENRRASFTRTRQVTIHTSSIITSCRSAKLHRRRICGQLRTEPSRQTCVRIIPISNLTPASTMMITRKIFVATVAIPRVRFVPKREKRFGVAGNLFIPATPGFLAESCACLRTLSGVTVDYGATIRSPC